MRLVAALSRARPAPADGAAPGAPGGGRRNAAIRAAGRLAAAGRLRTTAGQLLLLACYLAAGVAVNWPRAAYLPGHELPATRDAGAYVWGFWWVARQLLHLASPFSTTYLAAPVGAQLALHALMPLEGVVMLPVTAAFGPSASYNLLSAAAPGLLCYAAYRVARLWLPSQTGAIAAGAFFGLSSMLGWRSWYHLNIALGAVFLPLAVEAAVWLRRRPGIRQAVVLGLVLAGSLLTDQESAVMVVILAGLVLAPWLVRRPDLQRVRATAVAGVTALVASAPQLAAVAAQAAAGGASQSKRLVANSYPDYGIRLAGLFAPSPRVAGYGLKSVGALYYRYGTIYHWNGHSFYPVSEATPMFGAVLTALAVAGLAVSWRRRSAWWLALVWLGSAALALGPVLWIGAHAYTPLAETLHRTPVSTVMPYTWFVQIPGLGGFREAGRLAELGLLPAALLAGATVGWLRRHAAPALVVVAAAGALEAGWGGNLPPSVMPTTYQTGTMPTAMPALDRPIAADHSQSIVVDFPFGIDGGTTFYGARFDPEAQVLATADGHPRAVAYLSRVPPPTIAGIRRHPFYADMVSIWNGGRKLTPLQALAARQDARAMNVGWVLVWPQQQLLAGKPQWFWNSGLVDYLQHIGFRFDYQADGVLVYRAAWPGATLGGTGP